MTSDFWTHDPITYGQKIFFEKVAIKWKHNGHHCRSLDRDGDEITHTKETENDRLFLYREYEYYQINNCPFCGYEAKVKTEKL
jgi:hypothetical protein